MIKKVQQPSFSFALCQGLSKSNKSLDYSVPQTSDHTSYNNIAVPKFPRCHHKNLPQLSAFHVTLLHRAVQPLLPSSLLRSWERVEKRGTGTLCRGSFPSQGGEAGSVVAPLGDRELQFPDGLWFAPCGLLFASLVAG